MNTNKYELSVLVNGKNISKLSHEGKFFIEGREGTEYTLKVSNNTGKRVLAVVSVDGVNVIDGSKTSDQSTGYIVRPYSTAEIKGFRESTTHVGAFKFVTKDKSYAKEAAGSTKNCGVIGCMIIEEKVDPLELIKERLSELERKKTFAPEWPANPIWYDTPYWVNQPYSTCDGIDTITRGDRTIYSSNIVKTRDIKGPGVSIRETDLSVHTNNDSMRCVPDSAHVYSCSLSAPVAQAAADFDLGSTWGQKIYDKVETVEFERGNIVETIEIYYASRESLEGMGVPVVNKKSIAFPSAFPGQFCKPPSNY